MTPADVAAAREIFLNSLRPANDHSTDHNASVSKEEVSASPVTDPNQDNQDGSTIEDPSVNAVLDEELVVGDTQSDMLPSPGVTTALESYHVRVGGQEEQVSGT